MDILGRGKKITQHCIAEAEKWFVSEALSFKIQDHTHENLPGYNFMKRTLIAAASYLNIY